MRNLIAPVVLVTSLALGSAAFAATTPAKPVPATASRSSDCVKQWKAEKKHTQTRKAFLAACTARA